MAKTFAEQSTIDLVNYGLNDTHAQVETLKKKKQSNAVLASRTRSVRNLSSLASLRYKIENQ